MAVALYVIAVLVLLFAVLQVVGALIFAFGFKKEALDVREPEWELGIAVRSIGNGVAVIEANQPRQDIGHPGIVGMFWNSGYAQLGEVRSVESGRFTRDYTTISGEPPVCDSGWEKACQVGLDGYAYPANPSNVGRSHGFVFRTPGAS